MTTKPEESPKGTMLHRNPRFHTCENPQGKLTPAMAAGILAFGAGFAVGHFQAVRERARRQLEERLSWVSDNCPVRRICSDFIQGQAAAHASSSKRLIRVLSSRKSLLK
jgi:hypothetical protein